VSLLSRKLFAHTRAYLRIMKHKLHERIKRTDSLQKMDFTLNRVSSTFSFRGMNFLLINWSDLFVSSKLCKLERKIECRFFFNLTKIEIARLEQYTFFPFVTCRFFAGKRIGGNRFPPLANHCRDSPFCRAPFRFRCTPLESFHPSLILCRNPLSLVSYIRLR